MLPGNKQSVNPTSTCYVYILQGSNKRYYTGITKDLTNRLQQHNKGYCKSTRKILPVSLIWTTQVKDRLTARRLEIKIKNYSAKKFLLHQKYKYNRPYNNQISSS